MFTLTLIGAVLLGLFLGAVAPDNSHGDELLDIDLWKREG